MDNHAEFEKEVLRVVAALYAAHPRAIDIGAETTLNPQAKEYNADYKDLMASSNGTITWLYRNNIVTGNLIEGDYVGIIGAQLSAQAYRILKQKDGAITDQSLGHAAVRASTDVGSREETVVAELVSRKLS